MIQTTKRGDGAVGLARTVLAGVLVVGVAGLTGCGGGSAPTAPSTPAPSVPLPSGGACGALGSATSIVNGADCPRVTSTAVVLVNLRDEQDDPSGACSGTVIAPRAVLTAAHCLAAHTASVRIFLGSGPQIPAKSFAAYPNYRENDPSSIDVGVVLTATDIGVEPVPLLLGRDARVGEGAIIAGWGRDQNTVGATLRAGVTSITAVGPSILQTEYSAIASSVCQGDSGGPLLLSEGGIWAVAGVTSANQTTSCAYGTNYYAAVRNAGASAFILDHVPDAERR